MNQNNTLNITEKCDICKHRTCLLDEFPCNKCKEFLIDGEDMFEIDWGE